MTIPKRVFNRANVNVGRYTYGSLNIYDYGNDKEFLTIGDFVSIASDVKFILGGNHNMNTISLYPFKVKIEKKRTEALTKGAIVVEDDVWIGMNVIILSGVRIGRGSVIAAGSIVTKDIQAYSIVAGNPAKVIKSRFEQQIIEKMFLIDYKKIGLDFIKDNIDLFNKLVNDKFINEFLIKYNKYINN